MNNLDILKIKFPDLKMDFLTRSAIPRIRILFSNNIFSSKDEKDNILKILFNNKEINSIIMFWSGNSKKIRNKDKKDIESFCLNTYIAGSCIDVVNLEKNLFGHRFFSSISLKDSIRLTDISINNGNGLLLPELSFGNYLLFLFDSNFNFIVNVYGFEGMDISSYDKKFLFSLDNLLKNKFSILSDQI